MTEVVTPDPVVLTGDWMVPELRRAGELLRRRGWCQGQACSRDGRMCIVGALSYADMRARERDDYNFWELTDFVRQHVPGSPDLAEWNDAPERTRAEVLNLLQRTLEHRQSEWGE